MLVDSLSKHYIRSYCSVLLTVLLVIVGFESLLHLLKLLKNTSFFSQAAFFAFRQVICDFPDKIADILPLSIYIALGVHHYLWSSKNYALIISLIGFEPKRFQSISMILVLLFFVLSVALKGFIAPGALSYHHALNNTQDSAVHTLTLDNYQDFENFYKFHQDNAVSQYNFREKNFKKSQCSVQDEILFVDEKPLLNIEIAQGKNKSFESMSLTKKIDLSLKAPGSQKDIVYQALSDVLIHPLCCLMALLLGFFTFPLTHPKRHQPAKANFILSLSAACFIFLTQHVFVHFIILPWETLCLTFFFCHFTLVFLLMQISKFTLR